MKRPILSILAPLLMAVVITILASERIWTETGLEALCKEKTRAYFVATGGSPTGWRPSMLSTPGEGVMAFYGNWRVGAKRYDVMTLCAQLDLASLLSALATTLASRNSGSISSNCLTTRSRQTASPRP